MIYELREELAYPLVILFRSTMEQQKLPKEWKDANVTAIYKGKGPKDDPSNYRPVSLTCVICKIFEKIVRSHVTSHLCNTNFFTDAQFGFRSKRSCTLQLIDCIDKWLEAWDEGKQTDVAFLDFRKAFDKVPHRRLMHKLRLAGIQNPIAAWVESFLMFRRQKVVIGNIASSWVRVSSGVPQGSVLGPLLFLVYGNDLVEGLDSTVRLFADDTKIFRKICDTSDQEKLQEGLDKACRWCDKWQMVLNTDKCKVLPLGSRREEHQYELLIGNDRIQIEAVDKERDLGVVVDKELTFEDHILGQVKKARRVVHIIFRTFRYMSTENFVILFKTLVRPLLEYASPVWSPKPKKLIRLVEGVQRRATKRSTKPSLRRKTTHSRAANTSLQKKKM